MRDVCFTQDPLNLRYIQCQPALVSPRVDRTHSGIFFNSVIVHYDDFEEKPQNEPITNCKSIETSMSPVMAYYNGYPFRLYRSYVYTR